MQVYRFCPFLDLDLSKCFGMGSRRNPGRDECSELLRSMAKEPLKRALLTGPKAVLPPRQCDFEMVQKHGKIFKAEDGSKFICFSVYTQITAQKGYLSRADVDLELMPQGGCFLSADEPLAGAEFALPIMQDDFCRFREGTPHKGMYVGYKTSGSMTCGLDGSQAAFLSMRTEQSTEEGKTLSALMLLCLPASRLRFDLRMNVVAYVSCGRHKELVYTLCGKKVELTLFL